MKGLYSDYGMSRGNGVGAIGPRVEISENLEKYLPGFSSVRWVEGQAKGGLVRGYMRFICAVPDGGGEYKVICEVDSERDIDDRGTDEGLLRLVLGSIK